MHRVDTAGATQDNRFTDGNPATSTPATVVDAAILNAIVDELVYCVLQGGGALEKGNNTQLWQAIVRMLGNFQSWELINSNKVLSHADVGKCFGVQSGGPWTVTLPNTTNLRLGASIAFTSQSAFTITSPDAKNIHISAVSATSVTARGSIRLVWRGDTWQQVDLASFSVLGNGYYRFNDGLIIQWGAAVTPGANGILDITFPVTFPNACFHVSGIHEGGDGAMVISVGGHRTTTGWRALVKGHGGDTAAGWAIMWVAIGY